VKRQSSCLVGLARKGTNKKNTRLNGGVREQRKVNIGVGTQNWNDIKISKLYHFKLAHKCFISWNLKILFLFKIMRLLFIAPTPYATQCRQWAVMQPCCLVSTLFLVMKLRNCVQTSERSVWRPQILIFPLQPLCSLGTDPTSNRNEYRVSSWG
jgi:hypothetical protein